MKQKRLRVICAELGVSRRAVQGYEAAGLVAPSGKTERGYLLYDEAAQARIAEIRLHQRLGFSLKEIRALFSAPPEEYRAAVLRQIRLLEGRILEIRQLLRETEQLLNKQIEEETK